MEERWDVLSLNKSFFQAPQIFWIFFLPQKHLYCKNPETPEVATMMSAEFLGQHMIGRLDWGDPAVTEPVEDKFVDGVARSQVIWT